MIDTVAPTVTSYSVLFGTQSFNMAGSTRNRLPWQITGIQVVFSKPIATATTASLTGLTATGVTGLGTNALTWTIVPVTNLPSTLTAILGNTVNAVKDAAGRVDRQTVALDYLAASERTKNHRQGVQVQ